jgi:hypothetical protein
LRIPLPHVISFLTLMRIMAPSFDFCAEFDFGADFGAAFFFYSEFNDTSNKCGSYND